MTQFNNDGRSGLTRLKVSTIRCQTPNCHHSQKVRFALVRFCRERSSKCIAVGKGNTGVLGLRAAVTQRAQRPLKEFICAGPVTVLLSHLPKHRPQIHCPIRGYQLQQVRLLERFSGRAPEVLQDWNGNHAPPTTHGFQQRLLNPSLC